MIEFLRECASRHLPEGKKVSIGSQGKGNNAPDSAMELTWSRRGREGVFVPLPALDRWRACCGLAARRSGCWFVAQPAKRSQLSSTRTS